MQLVIRLTGTDRNTLIEGLEQMLANVKKSEAHVGQDQLATSTRGWFGSFKWEDVPVPQPRPALAAASDKATRYVGGPVLPGAAFLSPGVVPAHQHSQR